SSRVPQASRFPGRAGLAHGASGRTGRARAGRRAVHQLSARSANRQGYTLATVRVAAAYVVEPMRLEHIPAVSAIEKLSFPQPWPQNAYRREISENRMAHYIVARRIGTRNEPQPPAPEATGSGQPASGDLIGRLSRLLRPPEPARSPQLEEQLRSIVGYAGIWVMTDEAHITSSASHPDARGQAAGA